MKIDIRTPEVVYIEINNKTFYIDDSTNESIINVTEEESQMQYDNFIKEYILPNENESTRLKYYQGNLEFDEDYLLEIAKHNNIDIVLNK